jgi:type IV secretion system protein VirB10
MSADPKNEDPPTPPPVEALRLRADPPRVAQLSRPMIAVLSGAAAVAIGGALVLALQPRTPKPAAPQAEASAGPPAAAVSGAPKTYGDVPKLGPPLPGDLGRPIVAAQQRGATIDPPPIGGPASGAGPTATQRSEARRQVLDAARASALFTGAARTPSVSARPEVAMATAPLATPDAPPAGPPAPRQAFLDRPGDRQTVSAYRLSLPASPNLLQAGSTITAALITSVRSDLPGPVSAQVTRNVYDSLSGRILLIPQGSRLIGTYDAQVSFGQKRVLLAWDRLILPDGRSLLLDRLVGADAGGRSGLEDGVDAHWGAMAKAALLSSVLGIGAELGSDDDGDVARALRRGVQDTVNQTGQQVVRRQLDVQPTLTLRAGLPLTILVTRDMVLEPAAATR